MTTDIPRFAYESRTTRRQRQLAEFDALTGTVSSLVASAVVLAAVGAAGAAVSDLAYATMSQ